ncbi:hypothetical protein ISCGN_020527, partial [Ixodes scapularis]
VVGVIFSTVGWVLSYSLPTTLLDPLGQDNYMVIGRSVKLATSLFPNCGLYWCYRLISYFEGQGIGASWTNINNQAVPSDNVTLLEIMLVMIGSVFIYGLLLWYLDNVWPYQYGIPKHPLYFLQQDDEKPTKLARRKKRHFRQPAFWNGFVSDSLWSLLGQKRCQ